MSLFVAVPSYTGVRAETVGTITQLMVALDQELPGSVLNIYPDNADLRCVRSEQVGNFLYSGARDFLFLDSDIAVSPSVVARMHAVDADCVTLAYRKRRGQHEYCIKLLDGVDHPARSPIRRVGEERLIEIDGAGLGCMLIKRHVLETVRDRYPELMYLSDTLDKPVCMMFQPGIVEAKGKRRALGEDIAFCLRVRACGFKIECLVDAEVDHAGIIGNLRESF